MTKEELKEQDIRLNKLCFDYQEKEKRIAELEKENAELKELIEKMKCPLNCENGSVYKWADNSICMDCEKVRTLHEDNWQELCKGCEYWEKENE